MNTKLDKILAEISAGELIDKITILEIKKAKIKNKDKLTEIEKELLSLNEIMKKFIPDNSKISKFKDDLKNINLKLWDIEDGKRSAEKIVTLVKNLSSLLETFINLMMKELKLNWLLIMLLDLMLKT